MEILSEKEDSSELMVIVKMKNIDINDLEFKDIPLIVLFDRPSNKGNLGSIIRSCDAIGVDLLIVTGHSVDIYDPFVISNTMGSFFNMNIIRFDTNSEVNNFISLMKNKYFNFKVIGTTAHKKKAIYDINMKEPIMLMIGNETEGLSNSFYEYCDELGTIPINPTGGASSFNVACATTTILYECIRQRNN